MAERHESAAANDFGASEEEDEAGSFLLLKLAGNLRNAGRSESHRSAATWC